MVLVIALDDLETSTPNQIIPWFYDLALTENYFSSCLHTAGRKMPYSLVNTWVPPHELYLTGTEGTGSASEVVTAVCRHLSQWPLLWITSESQNKSMYHSSSHSKSHKNPKKSGQTIKNWHHPRCDHTAESLPENCTYGFQSLCLWNASILGGFEIQVSPGEVPRKCTHHLKVISTSFSRGLEQTLVVLNGAWGAAVHERKCHSKQNGGEMAVHGRKLA